ncbi:type IV secretion system protein VirB10 [Acetobacter sp.]|uniref:type IV secretion system protein VirB10 n=1 Tax=Acetobacter sp. TaxID=440 RepID=UPI0039E9FC90
MSDEQNNNSGINDGGSLVSNNNRRELNAWQKVGIFILVVVVALGFIWLRALDRAKKTEEQNNQPVVAAGTHMRSAPLTPPPALTDQNLPMPQQAPQRFFMPAQATHHEVTPAESPIFAASGGSGGSSAPQPASAQESPKTVTVNGAQPPAGQDPQGDRSLAVRLKPTVLEEARARLLPHPDFLVTKGTIIPCILQTKLNTQLAGYAKCVIPLDVRSTTGNVVLMDKGTIVTGEMQHGLMRGEDRAFVIWDLAETPEHGIIDLASPATGELGESGVKVTVNNHWWSRFGSAILLSVIQGGLDAGVELASRVGSNNSGAYFNSFQSNGQTVANTALQADINIQPTGEKAQGKTVAIFVARDLDFSDIYDLKPTVGSNAQ